MRRRAAGAACAALCLACLAAPARADRLRPFLEAGLRLGGTDNAEEAPDGRADAYAAGSLAAGVELALSPALSLTLAAEAYATRYRRAADYGGAGIGPRLSLDADEGAWRFAATLSHELEYGRSFEGRPEACDYLSLSAERDAFAHGPVAVALGLALDREFAPASSDRATYLSPYAALHAELPLGWSHALTAGVYAGRYDGADGRPFGGAREWGLFADAVLERPLVPPLSLRLGLSWYVNRAAGGEAEYSRLDVVTALAWRMHF